MQIIDAKQMERLYSRQAVRECLRAGRRPIHRLHIADGVRDASIVRDIVSLAKKRGVPLESARRDSLDERAQGVALDVGAYPYADVDSILALARTKDEAPLILILDAVQDVQNFGALIRAAEAVGAHGVLIGQHRGAPVTPAVVNASAGAVEHMLVAQVVNLARELERLKKADVWTAALAGDDARAQDLFATDLRGSLALIIGSEGEGVSRLLRERADFVLRLPMRGQIGSLNAAVAGAVALYEAARQRAAL